MSEKQTVAETKYLRLVDRAGWSYAERTNASGVVCVVACNRDDRLLLVEQHRPPLGCNVIELPAGLAGDIAEQADERLEDAARRELLEETGYRAEKFSRLVDVTSSAGITNEVVTMFLAHGLEKVAEGGGDSSENIVLHEIPIDKVEVWLIRQLANGLMVDSRVYAGLFFISQQARNSFSSNHG